MIVVLAIASAFGVVWSWLALEDHLRALMFLNLTAVLLVWNQVADGQARQERRFQLFLNELRLRSRR